jgi:DNA-binding IclR family transcriptional regulator
MESAQLVKVFALLEASAGQPAGRPLADLAADASLPKPTAHRLLKTLVALGYMERVGNGVYRHALPLRRLVADQDERTLVRQAEPLLRLLHERTRETINLGTLRAERVVYLQVLESPQPLRRIVNPTMTDPFGCTALGRAIAAFLPADRQNFLLKQTSLEKRTPHTVVDPDQLRVVLEATKQRGYASEENETDLGVMCLGAPVFDGLGVIAAISISLPTVRADEQRCPQLVAELLRTAKELSQRLGGPP